MLASCRPRTESEFQHTRHDAKSANGRLSAAATNGTENRGVGTRQHVPYRRRPAARSIRSTMTAAFCAWLFDACQDHLICFRIVVFLQSKAIFGRRRGPRVTGGTAWVAAPAGWESDESGARPDARKQVASAACFRSIQLVSLPRLTRRTHAAVPPPRTTAHESKHTWHARTHARTLQTQAPLTCWHQGGNVEVGGHVPCAACCSFQKGRSAPWQGRSVFWGRTGWTGMSCSLRCMSTSPLRRR